MPHFSTTTQPFVCGVLGERRQDTLARLIARSPSRLRLALRTEHVELWASDRLERWSGAGCHGALWSSLANGTRPTTWHAASEERMACGVEIGPGRGLIHTDALAVGDLYVRRHGPQTMYFATRIDPLTALDDSELHVDWSAWAGIFAIHCPVGDATPFHEIRRVEAASAWSTTTGGIECVRFESRFVAETERPTVTEPDDVIDALSGPIRRLPRQSVAHVTLSGGWDSRLLASLLARSRRRRTLAWTTSPDDGRDLDVSLSKPVATALGIRQRLVIPGPDAWVQNADEVRARLQYQTTMHTWLMPIARRLHAARGPVVDGFGGDFLLKGLWLTPAVLEVADASTQRQELFETLGALRIRAGSVLDPAAATVLYERAWSDFVPAFERFAEHPSGLTIGLLHTRAARGVAGAPLCLFGPECRVVLPFVDPNVLAACLRVPVRRKVGGDFYRRVLEHAAGPVVAALPSTNDKGITGAAGPRRQASDAAVSRLVDEIRSDDVAMAMLSPAWRDRVARWHTGATHPALEPASLTMLQTLGMFGAWRSRYRSNLAATGGPD